MADKMFCGPASPSSCSPSHLNSTIRDAEPKCSPSPYRSGGPETGSGPDSPRNPSPDSPAHFKPSSRTQASISPLRTLGSLSSADSISSSTRTCSQSLASSLSSSTSSTGNRSRCLSGHQEETDALWNLILEAQGQRLNDQRASVSLLSDPGPTALCGTCSHSQELDFYCMLIHYQSDRMEDQRCPLPDLDDVVESNPEGQDEFFSLIQRMQSRRMDEQRASLLITEDDDEAHAAGSSPIGHCHHN